MPRRTEEGPARQPAGKAPPLVVERELVARRAYEIWESEGRPEGFADLHWQRAEEEVVQRGPKPKRTDV